MSAQWRAAIDSLAFRPDGHLGHCIVHRRALRTLIGTDPTPAMALAYFRRHAGLFATAAAAKIGKAGLETAANFHLTSRDLRRQRDVATGTESAAPLLDTDLTDQ